MSLPLALRTFQVPCPTQVKLTSLLSAMLPLHIQPRSEKRILPSAQHKDADGSERPEIGEDEIARLPVEPEQEDAQQHEHADLTPLDASRHEQQNRGQG